MTEEKSKIIYSRVSPFIFSGILVFPSIIWVFLDKSVWPWDQAWYGQTSVNLYYQLVHQAFSEWWSGMIHAFGIKSPAIAWFGQIFVPLRKVFGSVETALLLQIILVQYFSLILFFFTLKSWLRSYIVAYTGIMMLAGTPLFVGLGHQYFVEPLQLFSVVFLLFLLTRESRWNSITIIITVVGIVFYGLLVKVSTPLYMIIPLVVLCWRIFPKVTMGEVKKYFLKNFWHHFVLVFLSGVFIFVGICWYIENSGSLFDFVRSTSSGEVANLYGTHGSFLWKVFFWLKAFIASIGFRWTWILLGVILLGIIGKFLLSKNKLSKPIETHFLISIGSFLLVLVVFSFQVNEETRYILPALPYCIVIILEIFSRVNNRIVQFLFGTICVFQWAAIHGGTLQVVQLPLNSVNIWGQILLEQSELQKTKVLETIKKICIPESEYKTNIIAVELPWFNANSFSYLSDQFMLDDPRRNCRYTSLGYAESDGKRALTRVREIDAPFVVMLRNEEQIKRDAFNAVSVFVIDALKRDNVYVPVDDGLNEIEILKKNN